MERRLFRASALAAGSIAAGNGRNIKIGFLGGAYSLTEWSVLPWLRYCCVVGKLSEFAWPRSNKIEAAGHRAHSFHGGAIE
jgi:hypothetical protein